MISTRKIKIVVKETKGSRFMAKKENEITIRSSAAEYLTYVASVGDQQEQ
jgi:hypothetical protein